jgi:hypothetical protein
MKSLKNAYPRYSLTIGTFFIASCTVVCHACLQIIEFAKKSQLNCIKQAFSDSKIPLLHLNTDDLDTYALENMVCQILDRRPELFPFIKKEVIGNSLKYYCNFRGYPSGSFL